MARKKGTRLKKGSGLSPKAKPTSLDKTPKDASISTDGQNLSHQEILALQGTQGNAYVQRLLKSENAGKFIQREALGDLSGKPMASISLSFPGYTDITDQIAKIETELVPFGQKAGKFEGDEKKVQAYSRVWGQANLCAVVQDKDGRYHALKTDYPGRSEKAQVNVAAYPHNFSNLWWVNLPGRGDPGSGFDSKVWSARAEKAAGLWGNWKAKLGVPFFHCPHNGVHNSGFPSWQHVADCLNAEYVSLLSVALDISPKDIYVARSKGDYNPDAMVTFDLHMEDAKGKGGTVIPTDQTTPVKTPSLAIGPLAFDGPYLNLLSTAIHETQHYSHALTGEQLLEQWRNSGSKDDFKKWLDKQVEKKMITKEQADLTKDMTKVVGESESSEMLGYLEGFMGIYHRLPTDDEFRFVNINRVKSYWMKASHEVTDNTIKRLKVYYQGLDEAHKKDLEDYARQGYDNTMGSSPEAHNKHIFWQRLYEEALGKG